MFDIDVRPHINGSIVYSGQPIYLAAICTVAGSYSFGIFFIYIESIDILIPMFIGGIFMTIAGSYRYDTW